LNYLHGSAQYDNGGQAAQSFALWHNLVPDDLVVVTRFCFILNLFYINIFILLSFFIYLFIYVIVLFYFIFIKIPQDYAFEGLERAIAAANNHLSVGMFSVQCILLHFIKSK
jgi:hypothetical protein